MLRIGVFSFAVAILCAGSPGALQAEELDCLAARPVHDVLAPDRSGPVPGPGTNTTVTEKRVAQPTADAGAGTPANSPAGSGNSGTGAGSATAN